MLDGPLLFVSSALQAPTNIVELAAFAQATRRDLRILLRMPGRTDKVIFNKRLSMWRESLPANLQTLTIEGMLPKDVRATLSKIATKSGGLLAIHPTRRGNPSRAFNHNDYETFLVEGPMPVLALPPDGTIGAIHRILFPIDLSPRSDAVLDQTIELCKELGASLHLLHVYGSDRLLPSEMDMSKRLAASSPRELFTIDQQHIKQLTALASAQNVDTTTATAEGRAHEQILQYVKEHQIDLVVMATHGPRNSEDIFFGSTTIRTILKSAVPVIGVQC
jgi:nucleotide-binding universal stress UspA family protein